MFRKNINQRKPANTQYFIIKNLKTPITMKHVLTPLLFLLLIPLWGMAQPTIDGTFDGTTQWGSPLATDGDGSWTTCDLDDLYVTADETYVYFGVTFTTMQDFLSFGFTRLCMCL